MLARRTFCSLTSLAAARLLLAARGENCWLTQTSGVVLLRSFHGNGSACSDGCRLAVLS